MTNAENAVVALLNRLADEDPPPDPGRRAAIARRVDRAQRRRRAWTAGLAVLGLTLGAAVMVARDGGERVREDVNAAAAAGGYIPAGTPVSWTAVDGQVYQRLTVVTLDTAQRSAKTVSIDPGDGPIGIIAHCSTGHGNAWVAIGNYEPPNGQDAFDCATSSPPLWHDFDLDQTPRDDSGRIALDFRADIAGRPAVWTFGVYRWGPFTDAPSLSFPVLPRYAGQFTLAEDFTGAWPGQAPVQATVSTADTWGVVVQCTGAIAGQAGYIVHSNLTPPAGYGGSTSLPVRCDVPGDPVIPTVIQLDAVSVVPAELHISVEFAFDPMYDHRLGTWAIGLYKLDR